jgi:group I intron endonuclease
MAQSFEPATYLPDGVNPGCGIYMIKNMRNGKKYIGSTKNAKVRSADHFKGLEAGNHCCTYLQRAWNVEEDKNVFKFFMFIYCDEAALGDLEQACLDGMTPEYNVNPYAKRPPNFSQWPTEAQKRVSNERSIRISNSHPNQNKTSAERSEIARRSAKTQKSNGSGFYGPNNPNLTLSPEQLIARGKKTSKTRGERHPNYGKKGAATREANGYSIKGDKNIIHKVSKKRQKEISKIAVDARRKQQLEQKTGFARARPVVELASGKTFVTITEAARFYGLDPNKIGEICRGNRKSTGPNKQKFAYLNAGDNSKVKTDD